MDPDYLNCLVHDYISTVDQKLAKKFKKEAKLTSELPPGSPVIGDVVKYFNETSNNTKKKRKNDFPKEESTSIKKSKEDPAPDDVVLLKQELKKRLKPVERKKIFIRNVRKDCTYEDFQEKVEKFGEVADFFNPGRGCFITFASAKAAQECVAALNKTEIAGKIVLINIAREESEAEANTIEGCKLFVHGVKQETDEEDIKAAFEEFGKVVDSFNPGKGFAFVTFSTPEEATAAAEALNGKEVCGSTVSVNVSKPKVNPEADKNEGVKAAKNKKEKKLDIRLFVNNVGEDTSQDDLKAAFSAHGYVTNAYNPGKGFAFVDFATEDEANAAIEALNGKEVCGKEVECNIAKFKKKVQKGRARS
eukprot:TRINITY_DN717_c0_g1_i5.p1 TRINITY_DN717_c0_g1~~TRINITY_DN717_c0_g1_i5.p1  ORF type:complete len:381 (+),score=141.73 TRINITY_DN717_c0_g1_i5:60-1145(+)